VPHIADRHEIRQIVVVGIAVIEEPAFLDQQTSRVDRTGRSRVPADRPYTGHGRYRRHGARDAVAFLGLIEIGVAFPPPAVRRDLVTAAHRILCEQRQPLDEPAR
jgi:hypothetical protein